MEESNNYTTPPAPGTLLLVASPIGNLGDTTLRAIEALASADIVACEDTRHSRRLFDRHNISPRRTVSYHARNIDRQTGWLVEQLRNGATVALLSDAGTPGISDPGAVLTREVVAAGLPVSVLPGPSASLMVVTASGFPSHRFIHEGFLPRKKGRKKIIESWHDEERTIIFFESPERIIKSLKQINELIGARHICVGREMTKKFEEFLRGDIKTVIEMLVAKPSIKGEISVALAPARWFVRSETDKKEEII